jgi:hypothetical protein
MQTLIEPLCVSALNTPPQRASAQVFLRVLKDSLFGVRAGSNLLLPLTDLTSLFPQAAARWLENHGGSLHTSARVESIQQTDSGQWLVNATSTGGTFDALVLAGSATASARLLQQSAPPCTPQLQKAIEHWTLQALAMEFEEIATVYAYAAKAKLPKPMLALHSDDKNPAQFVFDKGQLGGPSGLLAFVVSANTSERESVQAQVVNQGDTQLAHLLGKAKLNPIQTIVEKRATFSCTPGLERPPAYVAPGLVACGDYIDGPYPATLEGAVRSGLYAGSVAFSNGVQAHKLNH